MFADIEASIHALRRKGPAPGSKTLSSFPLTHLVPLRWSGIFFGFNSTNVSLPRGEIISLLTSQVIIIQSVPRPGVCPLLRLYIQHAKISP